MRTLCGSSLPVVIPGSDVSPLQLKQKLCFHSQVVGLAILYSHEVRNASCTQRSQTGSRFTNNRSSLLTAWTFPRICGDNASVLSFLLQASTSRATHRPAAFRLALWRFCMPFRASATMGQIRISLWWSFFDFFHTQFELSNRKACRARATRS